MPRNDCLITARPGIGEVTISHPDWGSLTVPAELILELFCSLESRRRLRAAANKALRNLICPFAPTEDGR